MYIILFRTGKTRAIISSATLGIERRLDRLLSTATHAFVSPAFQVATRRGRPTTQLIATSAENFSVELSGAHFGRSKKKAVLQFLSFRICNYENGSQKTGRGGPRESAAISFKQS
jgi:hypothetical protein